MTYANTYQPYFTLQASLKSSGDPLNGVLPSADKTLTPISVYIQLHRDVEAADEVVREIASTARIDHKYLHFSGGVIRVSVQQKYLDIVAAIDVVKSIQEAHDIQLCNNVARNIINADVEIEGVPFRGEGQVVAVADTGFDRGDINDVPAPFAGRVAHLYAVGRPATATDSGSTDDPNGHGTHVCGSVLGDGKSSKMGGRIEAPASKATLVVQSLLNKDGALANIADLTTLFAPPFKEFGARVHTNSWVSAQDPKNKEFKQYPYDIPATKIDDFVWNKRNMVILFAAGNDGMDKNADGLNDGPEIGSMSSAKNCITVGATESLRENDRIWDPAKFGAPIGGDRVANNAEGIAAFSSRGPTVEGRIKPDVVAPGTSILSTHSRNAPTMTDWGASTDDDWQFNGGTSMATPLVAGCAAVLRETWVKNGHDPSAALIKCLLINGAVDVDGQYNPSEAGPSPNFSSGWGRVNLAASVILPSTGDGNAGWGDDQDGLNTGDEVIIEVDIPKGGSEIPKILGSNTKDGTGSIEILSAHAYPHPTFKMTLVWSDYAGDVLQNDLNLTVVSADGKRERHGNQGAKEWTPGIEDEKDPRVWDNNNNVEQIVWQNMPPGKAKISVTGFDVKEGPQPYAWVWRIF